MSKSVLSDKAKKQLFKQQLQSVKPVQVLNQDKVTLGEKFFQDIEDYLKKANVFSDIDVSKFNEKDGTWYLNAYFGVENKDDAVFGMSYYGSRSRASSIKFKIKSRFINVNGLNIAEGNIFGFDFGSFDKKVKPILDKIVKSVQAILDLQNAIIKVNAELRDLVR